MIVVHPDGSQEEVFYRAVYVDRSNVFYPRPKKTDLRDYKHLAIEDAYGLAAKGFEIISIEKVTCASQEVARFRFEEVEPD